VLGSIQWQRILTQVEEGEKPEFRSPSVSRRAHASVNRRTGVKSQKKRVKLAVGGLQETAQKLTGNFTVPRKLVAKSDMVSETG
jgi:hypothetical protein